MLEKEHLGLSHATASFQVLSRQGYVALKYDLSCTSLLSDTGVVHSGLGTLRTLALIAFIIPRAMFG